MDLEELNDKLRNNKAVKGFVGVLWIAVLFGIGKKLTDIGLIDPTVVVSSFVGVGIVALICGIFLYQFVWKRLTKSMMGGFL